MVLIALLLDKLPAFILMITLLMLIRPFIGGSHGEEIYNNPLNIDDAESFLEISKKYNLFSYLTANFGIVSMEELPENNIYKTLNKTLKEEEKQESVSLQKAKDQKLDDYEVKFGEEKLSLMTFNFQFNQVLMLINNPMLFPHIAYAEMFNGKIGEEAKKEGES